MYKYLAFPLVEPIQDEEELRDAPPDTLLSETACKERVERGDALIRQALPVLFPGNIVSHNFAASMLHIESERDMSDTLAKLKLLFIDISD